MFQEWGADPAGPPDGMLPDRCTCPPLTICGPAPVKDTSAHLTATLAQNAPLRRTLGKSCASGRAGLILQGDPTSDLVHVRRPPNAREGPPHVVRGVTHATRWLRVSRRRSASRTPPTAATAYRDP